MDDELVITINQGTLHGSIYKVEFEDYEICAFRRIPYAKAPVNNLRFMPPEPLERWNGILDATKDAEESLHFSLFYLKNLGSEDCLYLNVFTPKPPRHIKSKAVIVMIHCGGFSWGSGSTKSFGAPDFVVPRDVIYVTMNYRLNFFGFLNLNLPNCAGNMGLKDQVMALKWVQKNIKYFGGDPDNVTLYGSSSGATSVHYHMMSPLSKGLFHKAILSSGYALSPVWNLMENPIEKAIEFGQLLGFKGNNTKRLLQFLKKKSATELLLALGQFREILKMRNPARLHLCPFLPSIEKFPEGAILTQSPLELIDKCISMPVIYALCQVEGTPAILADTQAAIKQGGLSLVVEKNLWPRKLSSETLKYITNKIQLFYFGQRSDYTNSIDKILELYSDMHTSEWQYMVDKQSLCDDVYVYLFAFEGDCNVNRIFGIPPQYRKSIKGSCHADDSGYFMYYKGLQHLVGYEFKYGPQSKEITKQLTTMLTNFAKKGNPSTDEVTWHQHTVEKPCYLHFGTNRKMINGRIYQQRADFWKEVMEYIKDQEENITK